MRDIAPGRDPMQIVTIPRGRRSRRPRCPAKRTSGGPVQAADRHAARAAAPAAGRVSRGGRSGPSRSSTPPERDTTLLAPVDGLMEVWAAGVTYQRSEEARMEESGTPDLYSMVYRAERPEIFLKATPRRVVGPEGTVVVRVRLDLGRAGAGAGDRRERPRRDRRLHHRQRRQLAEHRGREPALPAAGEAVPRRLRDRAGHHAGLGGARPVRSGDLDGDRARRRGDLGGRDPHQRPEAPPGRAGRATCSARTSSRTARSSRPGQRWCRTARSPSKPATWSRSPSTGSARCATTVARGKAGAVLSA